MDKKQNSDDFEVVSQIVSFLKDMDKESQIHILETVMTWLKINFNPTSPPSASPSLFDIFKTPTSKPSEITSNDEPSTSQFSTQIEMSPKQFMLEKQPKTDVERLACLAYYLTHYRDMPQFKTIDLSKLNTEAAQRKFANAAFTAKNAVKSHYLVQAPKKGFRQLSAIGEQAIAALPDHEAANSIMKRGRPRRATKISNRKGVSKNNNS